MVILLRSILEYEYIAPETIVINRGMGLHKMIRLITFALGGKDGIYVIMDYWDINIYIIGIGH